MGWGIHLSDDAADGLRGLTWRRLADIEARDAERDREYRRKKAEAEEAEREKDAACHVSDDERNRGQEWQQSLKDMSPEERKLVERVSDPSLSPAEQKRALAAYTRFLDRKDRDPDDEHFVSVEDPEVIEPLGDPGVNVSREGRRGWIKSFQSGERVTPKLDRAETQRRLRLAAEDCGMSFAEFTRPASRGRQSRAEVERRAKLAQALAHLRDEGASLAVLAAVAGCHVNTVSRLVQEARR